MVCQHAVLLLHVQFLAFPRIPLLLRCSEVLDSLNSDRDIMPLIEDLSTKFALVRWVESWCSSVRPRDHLRTVVSVLESFAVVW